MPEVTRDILYFDTVLSIYCSSFLKKNLNALFDQLPVS